MINGKSDFELLNVVSNLYKILPDVLFSGSYGRLYYDFSIGSASNLAVGDILYNNSGLSVTAASGTYTQVGTNSDQTHCPNNGTIMSMTLNSSGVITAISCESP